MRLMCDILVLAFRTDTTRVCTLKLNNDHSSLRFPNLGVDYMIHHLLSHSDGDDWLKVNQFFTQQVAYIAQKLDEVKEGERTLLDNSLILYLSSMMTGNHDNDQLPVVMLGGGGQIKTGRVLIISASPIGKCAACTCRSWTGQAFGLTVSATRRSDLRTYDNRISVMSAAVLLRHCCRPA